MSQSQSAGMTGPPYPPAVAGIGGTPTMGVDVPATSVFLVLYLAFAVGNMTILQINMRRKHIKFIISGAVFGFCMARTATCTLRLAWATHSTNARLAIAANIFVSAGILIIYVVNILFANRILRAKQPHIGWNPILRHSFKALYALIGLSLVGVITSVVLTLYTLNTNTRQICRSIQLAASTYLFVFTTIPWFLIAAAYLLPKSPIAETFGQGSLNKKALVNLTSTSICVLISGFKLGTAWMPPRPVTNPAWYHSKAAFYVFNFSLEICILILFMSTRIDKLFYVPDGSNGPGDYTSRRVASSKSSQHEQVAVAVEKV